MNVDALLIVVAGGQRYAVDRALVRGLQRGSDATIASLTDRLGTRSTADESCVLLLNDERMIRVESAELSASLPELPLPAWIKQQAHPAVQGLVLDQTELILLIDVASL